MPDDRKTLLEKFGLPDCCNLLLKVDDETHRVQASCYLRINSNVVDENYYCSESCPNYRAWRFMYENRECWEEGEC